MRAILPLNFPLAGEAQIGFMNDGGRLQRVACPLAPYVRARYARQFVVYQGNELTGDILIVCRELSQERRNIAACVGHCPSFAGNHQLTNY
jgi:hypothetical protein